MKRKTNKSKFEYEQILKLQKVQAELAKDYRPFKPAPKKKHYEQLLLPFNRNSKNK